MRLLPIVIIFFLLNGHSLHSQKELSPLLTSFEQYKIAKNKSPFNLDPILLGPVVNSARVESVQLDPTNPATMYIAFGSGNLWKTTNHGVTWKAIFEDQPAQGIGDIALSPSNSNIIYVGTGESLRKNRNFTMPGTGIYRSDDGGESWNHLGLSEIWHTGEISVHPTNPDIVFVAAMGRFWTNCENKGIYRSMDGGKNWEHVLYVDENTRAIDVVIAPSNPNYVYASMWENDVKAAMAESVYGPGSAVHVSKDGGKTWEKVDNGFAKGPKTGRIGLAVSYSNPEKVYALVDNINNERTQATEVYRTENAGEKWTRTHKDDLKFLGTLGWYFSDIYVNPQDDEEIFGLGIRVAHSSDGGKTFDFIAGDVKHINPSPAQTLHLDHCEMWVNPNNPEHLALGNDGGLYISYDKGLNWTHYNNIPAGEYYTITVDNEMPYRIFGGSQDDATVYGHATEFDALQPDPWKYLWIDAWSGGDGCISQVDPDDPNTVYFSAQNGWTLRRDMKADTSAKITGGLRRNYKDLRFNFVGPYILSPHDSKTIYLGGNYILKSVDRGDNWKKISEDLTGSNDRDRIAQGAGTIEESPLSKGLLYVGTDKGHFWTSENDGLSWELTSSQLPKAYIRSICASNFKKGRVYMTMTGLNYDDFNSYVYRSEDFGKTWHHTSNNLPTEPANVILEDPNNENILYVGSLRGVYISFDRGRNWDLFNNGMPIVSIADLKIQNREKDLLIGTHGRGIYKMELESTYEALKQLTGGAKTNQIFEIPNIVEPLSRDTHRDIDLQSIEKLDISFYLADDEEVECRIVDEKGKDITHWKFEGKRGVNQIRWNLVVKESQNLEPYFFRYKQYIRQGKYVLSIKLKSQKLTKKFEVEARFK